MHTATLPDGTAFASAEFKAEFSDRRPTATSRFLAAPDKGFRVESLDRSACYGEVGAGLVIPFAERWSATVSGSYEFGGNRQAVKGGLGVSHQF